MICTVCIEELSTVLYRLFTFVVFRQTCPIGLHSASFDGGRDEHLFRNSSEEFGFLRRLRVASQAAEVNLADKPVFSTISGSETIIRGALLVQRVAEVGVRTVESNLSV